MKETGIVRKIDRMGRVVLPKELRWKYKIDCGDMVEIFTTETGICIEKYDHGADVMDQVKLLFDTVEQMEKDLKDTQELQEYLSQIKGKLEKLGSEADEEEE